MIFNSPGSRGSFNDSHLKKIIHDIFSINICKNYMGKTIYKHKLARNAIAFLATVILLGCAQNKSKEPAFAPWIGKTVKLNAPYNVCKYPGSWLEHLLARLLGRETSYEIFEIDNDCSVGILKRIGTLPEGTSVKVLKVEHGGGMMSYEAQRQVILKVNKPDFNPAKFKVLYDFPYLQYEEYRLPWVSSNQSSTQSGQ